VKACVMCFILELISKSATETGVMLDNSYTGKAVYGLRDLMQNKPEVFKGRRILFIHSGNKIYKKLLRTLLYNCNTIAL